MVVDHQSGVPVNDGQILFNLLQQHCPDPEIKWLLEVIIFHDPTANYTLRGARYLQQKVPPHKSLFNTPENCGLPIGNLTSQFFANVYLNALDQFVKHVLKCRFYVRYVDDFILLAASEAQLKSWYHQIIHFLDTTLQLKLNPAATRLDSIFNGVDFVGFIIRPHYKLCRRRVIYNFKSRLNQFQAEFVTPDHEKLSWKYDFDALERLLATINAYLGHLKHAQTRNVVREIYQQFPFLQHYFQPGMRRVIRKYRPGKHIQSLKAQVNFFTRIFSQSIVLIEIGCYYEAFGPSAQKLHALLGYRRKAGWRNFSCASGFHRRLLPRVCQQLDKIAMNYTVIRQTGKYLTATMERLPVLQVQHLTKENS